MRARDAPMRTATLALSVLASGLVLAQPAQPGGQREVRLTLHEGTSMAAALSPDGRTVAVDLLGALWTLNADGGTATRILDDGYDARMPAWSPDGRRIVFQGYRSSTWSIWTVAADGKDLQQVTAGPFDDREPHWSPDGTRIAFSSDRSGNYDVWVLTLATGAVEQITTAPSNDYMPAWSPDGRELAFASDRRDRPGVYAVTVDAAHSERLVEAVTGARGPSWSPDGRAVASVAAGARLMAAGKDIADASEDVFPFRPQWATPSEIL